MHPLRLSQLLRRPRLTLLLCRPLPPPLKRNRLLPLQLSRRQRRLEGLTQETLYKEMADPVAMMQKYNMTTEQYGQIVTALAQARMEGEKEVETLKSQLGESQAAQEQLQRTTDEQLTDMIRTWIATAKATGTQLPEDAEQVYQEAMQGLTPEQKLGQGRVMKMVLANSAQMASELQAAKAEREKFAQHNKSMNATADDLINLVRSRSTGSAVGGAPQEQHASPDARFRMASEAFPASADGTKQPRLDPADEQRRMAGLFLDTDGADRKPVVNHMLSLMLPGAGMPQ